MLDKLRKFLPAKFRKEGQIVPVVRLQGAIGMATPLRPGLSLAGVAQQLEKAFSMKKAPAVALVVNSPGGSPVQSRLIFQRIRDLAEEHEKEVLVFVEDVAASGGYMIAVAGDEIIADPSSILGSIGVVSAGFGLKGLIEKIGVERRVYTAGENKVTLDPFQDEKPADIEHLKSLQLEIHETFIDLVKSRRADVLSDNPDLFTGKFWAGKTARDLGLVDAIGDLRGTLKARYGEKTEMKLISAPKGLFGRRSGGNGISSLFGMDKSMADDLVSSVEERALWMRYGL
ncbi:S49 family peptidase [Roseibium sediminis]|uniref:S49 family peptidase n=1 Tax=Roseibium sediminis TaxID=1775174 RepID=UPI00123E2FAF|nr:S49 family peptidase [Roseibium sediminis]